MVAIIVAAHGESAPALLETAGMILGDTEGVTPVTFLPGQGPEDLIEEYQRIVPEDEEVLLLVDLFGGSPYNAGARFAAEREHADVVTGVNVPMLLEVVPAARRKTATLPKLVAKALAAGTKGVRSFKETMAADAAPAPAPAAAPAAAAEPAPAGLAPAGAAEAAPFVEPPRDPEKTMDVVFLRIDSRLIHGQVAGNWVNNVAPQTLIAASDEAAKDKLRKTLLLQVGPASARTNVLDIAKTVRVYYNPEYAGMRTMIVVENPVDALRLLREGIRVPEINVGGVTFKNGMTQLSEAVYATPEHIQAYKDIDALGVKMTIQQLPNSSRTDMMSRLREKGL